MARVIKNKSTRANTKTNKRVVTIDIPDGEIVEQVKENASHNRPWLPPVIDFLDNTGLRVGELCGTKANYTTAKESKSTNRDGLSIADVCDISGTVRKPIFTPKQSIQVTGKGGKTRTVPLSSKAREAVSSILTQFGQRKPGDRLVPVDQRSVRRGIREACEAIGYEGKFVAHSLRHRVGSRLVNGGNIKTAQQALGHASPAITLQYYTAVSESDMAEHLEKM